MAHVPPRSPYRFLLACAGVAGIAHFLFFAGFVPWWRIHLALIGGERSEIARAYFTSFLSVIWASLATAMLWMQLRRWLAAGFGDTAASATLQADFDVGEALAASSVAPSWLRQLRRRRLEEDAIERAVEVLLAKSVSARERVLRAVSRAFASFVVGGCTMIGLALPPLLLGLLPDGSLLGVSYGAVIGVTGCSALVLATAFAYPAYHALRAVRRSASLRLLTLLRASATSSRSG